MITRTRGYLPHIEVPYGTYFLTFRLCDSLPQSVLIHYRQELEYKLKLSGHDRLLLLNHYEAKIENYLDASYGHCWLRDPRVARLVVDEFRKRDGHWYTLHAYTVMPNHVHVLFSLRENKLLNEVIRNWKGSSAFHANKVLQRAGPFWQREYVDKIIKSQRHFEYAVRYIFRNPVKAGLCKEIFQWPWSGSSPDIQYLLKRFFL